MLISYVFEQWQFLDKEIYLMVWTTKQYLLVEFVLISYTMLSIDKGKVLIKILVDPMYMYKSFED